MQLAVLISPDDGRVLKIHQVVVFQGDELPPDFFSSVFGRVPDNDQIAHLRSPLSVVPQSATHAPATRDRRSCSCQK